MNIYLSGSISNDPNFKEKFVLKAEELTSKGHNVYNPAQHPPMFTWEQFMQLDLTALSFCDAIYLMNGWEQSKGAKIEHDAAKKLKLKIFYEEKTQEKSIKFSKTIPSKTGTAYKCFYLKNGKLYPPMVSNPNGEATPVGSWIDANVGNFAGTTKTGRPQVECGGHGTHTSKGKLALRPGWHLGTLPIANQFNVTNPKNGKKELFPSELVWAEVEYSMDKDYQNEAMKEGITDSGSFRYSYAGLKNIPENGFYRYRTNPDPNTEEWVIAGQIKVNRILSNEEVDNILLKNGRTPPKRTELESIKKQNEITIER